ncbi:MAG: hypothetical protein IKZ48_01660 [Prevotella sp.]|nr:hypothetical protein [Prevotella sp.]
MPTPKEELLRRGLHPHDIQQNQHRRADWQDYGGTGLYMVTLCIEGRQGLFGHLEGDIRAQRDSAAFPHIVPSALGRAVLEEELPKIPYYYPQVELWKAALMPDHLHLLFYIREPLPPGKHLGHIISSFKGGCSRAWWAQQQAQTTATQGTAADATGTAAPVPIPAPTPVPAASAAVKRPPLFERGYHDRIIRRPGMLENIKRYMADNPLRALIRRQLPHLMERRLHLRVGAHDYAAFGALFLLKRAEKEQVFYHRRDKTTGLPTELTDSYRQQSEHQLSEAREGVVLVSPSISKGESLVIKTAIDEGLPVIQLQKEPIERYWKPERHRFEACARGTLLILYPQELDAEVTDYARFHRLNDLAAEICDCTDTTLLNVGEFLEPGSSDPTEGKR